MLRRQGQEWGGVAPVASTGGNTRLSRPRLDVRVRSRERNRSWARAPGAQRDKGTFCCPLLAPALCLSLFLPTWHIFEQGLFKLVTAWLQHPHFPIIWARRGALWLLSAVELLRWLMVTLSSSRAERRPGPALGLGP